MTQDERWLTKFEEVKCFIEENHRNPSKHDPEERGLYLNWIKHNRKLFAAGELKEVRVAKFKELLGLMEEYKRKNQYEYRAGITEWAHALAGGLSVWVA